MPDIQKYIKQAHMKKILVSLILVLFPFSLWSQELMVGFQYGFEGNNMHDLKDLNTNIISSVPFDTKQVSDFPGYWYYQPALKLAFKKFGIGLNYSYNSTGSRISGKDYSGEFRFDLRLNKKAPGVFIEYYLFTQKDHGFRLSCEGDGGFMFSSLHMEQQLTVRSIDLINDSFKFKAKNYYLQFGLKASYRWNSFEFEISGGDLMQFGNGSFHSETDSKQMLMNSSTGVPVKPEWGGIKVGVGINYILIKPGSPKNPT
jgi:hypothetical protein